MEVSKKISNFPILAKCARILIFGAALGRFTLLNACSEQVIFSNHPISSFLIHKSNYSLAYDARNRNPQWVYEHLTADSLLGCAQRSSKFKEDDNIPKHLRSTPADYRNQGFDKGHMAPAADHRLSPSTMSNTFYMTNVCPQFPQLNRGYWAKLERYVRDLTKSHENVHVFTGPLYLPYTDIDGKRYIKYQVIGHGVLIKKI